MSRLGIPGVSSPSKCPAAWSRERTSRSRSYVCTLVLWHERCETVIGGERGDALSGNRAGRTARVSRLGWVGCPTHAVCGRSLALSNLHVRGTREWRRKHDGYWNR
jgi:hypothetical protein